MMLALLYLVTSCLTVELAPRHVDRTIDGDTFVLFHVGIPSSEKVRVSEIDTPEKGQPGFEEAKAFTVTWLALGPFTMTACKRDSFGRYFAAVTRNGVSLAEALFAAGLGVRP